MNICFKSFSSQRRFGVELEVNREISQAALVKIVSGVVKKQGCKLDGWNLHCNNSQWIVKTDSSCGDLGDKAIDGGGFEVASAVGQGSIHLMRIAKVAEALKAGAVRTNNYCGLHCQVEIKDFSDEDAATLLAYWCKLEPLFANTVPERRLTSYHCKFFTKSKNYGTAVKQKSAADFWNYMKLKNYQPEDKRNTITLVNYQRTRSKCSHWAHFDRPTVELRLPEGTLSAFEIKNWARLFIHFVENTKGQSFPSLAGDTDLEEGLEILGLRDPSSFAVLSPGLHETKCWLLYRLYSYARNERMKQKVQSYWKMMTGEQLNWRYDFPKVPSPQLSKCI